MKRKMIVCAIVALVVANVVAQVCRLHCEAQVNGAADYRELFPQGRGIYVLPIRGCDHENR